MSLVSVVFNFSTLLNDFTPVFPMLLSVDVKRMKKKRIVDGCLLCVFFCFSQHRPSSVSVVFDFNALLNDFAPLSLILLSVEVMRMEKSELLMDVFCVFVLLFSPFRQSSMSVVFDFNASLNDFAPVSPISLSV